MALLVPAFLAVALSLSDVKAYLHSIASLFENVTEPTVVVRRLPKKGIPLILQRVILGQYDSETNTITITEGTLKRGRIDEMQNTLIHEMTHAWVHANNVGDKSHHGPAFQKKYREVCEKLGRKPTGKMSGIGR